MNDQELDRAIRTAHELLRITAQGEQRNTISKHLAALLQRLKLAKEKTTWKTAVR